MDEIKEPKLTVIVPVDGTEAFLEKCLDSIINQTLQDIEIIVVNDCSTGNVNDLIKPYLNDRRVKYINLKKKLCLGGARNKGIQYAKGKYITFCDSDDWVDLAMYEDLIMAMEETDAEIGTCSLYREYPDRREGLYKCYYDRRYIINGLIAFKIFTFQYQFEINIVGQVTNKVYKKDFVSRNKLYFIENAYYEDLDYNFRAIHQAKKIVCVPKVKYHHLRRERSIVQSISKRHISDFFVVFKQIRTYLNEIDPNNNLIFNFYSFSERFFNLIIRQIFENEPNDVTKKDLIKYSISMLPEIFDLNEFIQYADVEKLRRHIQPYIIDTVIK